MAIRLSLETITGEIHLGVSGGIQLFIHSHGISSNRTNADASLLVPGVIQLLPTDNRMLYKAMFVAIGEDLRMSDYATIQGPWMPPLVRVNLTGGPDFAIPDAECRCLILIHGPQHQSR